MLGVPSTLVTLNVSLTESPTFRLSNALLAVKVQLPLASISKVPMVPTIFAGVKVLSGSSGSVAVKVPEVLTGASVSTNTWLSELTVAASLVPLIVICTVLGVPSTLVTLKVSLTESPTFKLSNALFAVKVQLPPASISKVPMAPTIFAGVNVSSGLSTSVLVKVPEVLTGASVSTSTWLSELTVAASLVPLIVI